MRSLTLLWQWIANDLAVRCHTSTVRDCKTVSDRVRSEGESFLTITLTDFGKDFERSLDQGFVGSNQFAGFHRRAGGLPVFLQGFLHQIFDANGGGGLLPYPSVEAIHAVRQLTLMFGKIHRPCSPERERKAVEGYVRCENDIRDCDSSRFRLVDARSDNRGASADPGSRGGIHAIDFDGPGLRHIFRLSFGNLFAGMEREIRESSLGGFMPKHGPGATADRLVGNQKYFQSEWPTRLEPYFPAGEFILPNWRYFPHYAEDVSTSVLGSEASCEGSSIGRGSPEHRVDLRFIEPGEERPVRVVLVPKTLKTPRVIAIEPTAMQYAQQAVLNRFLKGWRKDDYLSSFLGFDDQYPNQILARQGSLESSPMQEPNQQLAEKGSHSGSLATLDLSEASDRVSNLLVQFLMQDFPEVAGVLQATRSSKADVPGHGILSLAKFASMGSALCFPVEAMIFLTLILFGIQQDKGHRLTKRDLKLLLGKVRVYGDDIIVPVRYVDSTIWALELFGFKVNQSKSFWTGKFRESCGKEYYDGHDVSIVRFRRDFPASLRHAEEVISLVSFRNQLYYAGFWETCRRLDEEMILPLLKGRFPIVDSTSSVIGRHSIFPYKGESEHPELHAPLVKGYVVSPRIPPSKIDGIPALTKWLIAPSNSILFMNAAKFDDKHHMVRAGRPKRVDIKLRNAVPF